MPRSGPVTSLDVVLSITLAGLQSNDWIDLDYVYSRVDPSPNDLRGNEIFSILQRFCERNQDKDQFQRISRKFITAIGSQQLTVANPPTKDQLRRKYQAMLDKIQECICINDTWRLIKMTMMLARVLVRYAYAQRDAPRMIDIIQWTNEFFRDNNLDQWIHDRGGWEQMPDDLTLVRERPAPPAYSPPPTDRPAPPAYNYPAATSSATQDNVPAAQQQPTTPVQVTTPQDARPRTLLTTPPNQQTIPPVLPNAPARLGRSTLFAGHPNQSPISSDRYSSPPSFAAASAPPPQYSPTMSAAADVYIPRSRQDEIPEDGQIRQQLQFEEDESIDDGQDNLQLYPGQQPQGTSRQPQVLPHSPQLGRVSPLAGRGRLLQTLSPQRPTPTQAASGFQPSPVGLPQFATPPTGNLPPQSSSSQSSRSQSLPRRRHYVPELETSFTENFQLATPPAGQFQRQGESSSSRRSRSLPRRRLFTSDVESSPAQHPCSPTSPARGLHQRQASPLSARSPDSSREPSPQAPRRQLDFDEDSD